MRIKPKVVKARIDWQEHHLDAVMRYFSEGFTFQSGERLLSTEYFVDPHRGKVVFKFIVESKP